jgi:hypothetical protein
MSFDLGDQFKNEAQDTSGAFGVKDADELRILHFFSDSRFFGSPAPTTTDMLTTWGDVMKFVAGQNLHLYQFVAAKTLGIEVLSTPAGTSGEIEPAKARDKMVACGSTFRCAAITNIYDKFLGLPKSQDGYSLFNASSVASLEAHAK